MGTNVRVWDFNDFSELLVFQGGGDQQETQAHIQTRPPTVSETSPLKPTTTRAYLCFYMPPFLGAFQATVHQHNRYVPDFNNMFALSP